jgi:transcriptional regulator with XRE-family HTH domain
MTLEEYLKKYRRTQAAFAEESGISRASIIKYLKGEPPKLFYAMKIVKATKGEVSLKELGVLP